jgi:hypothetical protein
MHTGMIGERVTRPRSPLGATAWADVTLSAVSPSAVISDAHFASISSQCAVRRQRLFPSRMSAPTQWLLDQLASRYQRRARDG